MSSFIFHIDSPDKLPGKGYNESGDPSDFTELSQIKNWRQILSNEYQCEFIHDKKTFYSANHAILYKKYELFDKTYSLIFLNKNLPKRLKRLRKEEKEEWEYKKYKIIREIHQDKFTKCNIANKVLHFTKNAKLYHKNEYWYWLEDIRNICSNDRILYENKCVKKTSALGRYSKKLSKLGFNY